MSRKAILIVEDEPEMGRVLLEGLSQSGYDPCLAENAERALALLEEKSFATVVSDMRLPGMDGLGLLEAIQTRSLMTPVILITGFGTVANAVEAMRKGALDYLLKPFSLDLLEQVIESALSSGPAIKELVPEGPSSRSILTQDRHMTDLIHLCRRVAASKAPVLIQGESGTGKELISRYLHEQSDRRQGPFVAVNCASLPETLLESELFGHEKGAFTGAVARKIGKFELAHKGTILLDEISEMNTFLQAKILRVLQENEVDRIGGQRPVPIDARVIATTNRDLEGCIAKGEFRQDLYYRLNVISLRIPPLRERPGDIELLTRHFLNKFAADYGKNSNPITEAGWSWLKKQEWRGNVRELKNTLERAVLISPRSFLDVADFIPEEILDQAEGREVEFSSLCLREMEQKLIFQALRQTSGNRTHAAKILGISIRTLRNKLHEYRQALPIT